MGGEKRKKEHTITIMVTANTGHLICAGTLLSVFYMLTLNSHTSSTDRHAFLPHRYRQGNQRSWSEKLKNLLKDIWL